MSTSQIPDSALDYEDEIVEEVEYEDDNSGSRDEESVETTAGPETQAPVESSAQQSKKPGKVTPSQPVKDMKMTTPEAQASAKGVTPGKNPFPTFGDWTRAELSAIKIEFPVLGPKTESTNELTRASKPEARYWKSPVNFRYDSFSSSTLRINGVGVPFHTGTKYGTDFLYIRIPKHYEEAFSAAGKSIAPTRVTEPSLVATQECWWKIINSVEGKIGVIDSSTKKFVPKPVATILQSTQNGLLLDVIVSVDCKANTGEKEPLKSTTVRTTSFNLVRAFITAVDYNVSMPTRVIGNKRTVAEPKATKGDVATDELMKKLADLGL